MLKKFRYQILQVIALIVGSIVLLMLLKSNENFEKQKSADQLKDVHRATILRLESGVAVYATIVSSIRSFIQNSGEFPTEQQLQSYLKDLMTDLHFRDSIVVSWVDTNQVFRYCVTPTKIDPFHLKGRNVAELRPEFEINKLNKLMYENKISLFSPINLYEGWAAFPFNFSARNNKREVLGYIAPVLNVKYLLNQSYSNENDSLFLHQFIIHDTIDLTRETVYDGTKSYNKISDPGYYKLFNSDPNDFIYSELNFYDLKIRVGTAYKNYPRPNKIITSILYIWYALLIIFTLITILQLYRNSKLNQKLQLLNDEIEAKNIKLNNSILHIKTLIKEIHHRVKNNMQIISSLINLQSEEIRDNNIKSILSESKNRIQSMALVHQKLYSTENLSVVNIREYIDQLTGNLSSTFHSESKNVAIKVNVSNVQLKIDTIIPLGLIINELLTNSFKYAFKKESTGQIELTLIEPRKINEQFVLIYSDNGPGISTEKINNCETLGLQLVFMLSEQIGGKAEYLNTQKSTFRICFSN